MCKRVYPSLIFSFFFLFLSFFNYLSYATAAPPGGNHAGPLSRVQGSRCGHGKAVQVEDIYQVDPACMLKALGFNFMKVKSFQAVGFKCQPAPPYSVAV